MPYYIPLSVAGPNLHDDQSCLEERISRVRQWDIANDSSATRLQGFSSIDLDRKNYFWELSQKVRQNPRQHFIELDARITELLCGVTTTHQANENAVAATAKLLRRLPSVPSQVLTLDFDRFPTNLHYSPYEKKNSIGDWEEQYLVRHEFG